jgi:uncharacterized protein (DUF1015 family)
MSIIKPFRAIRPQVQFAQEVASQPYDVMNVAEARELAKDNPSNFLHISRAEIDLPYETDVYSAEVYQKAKENLENLQNDRILIQDEEPSLYVYRLQMDTQIQTSIVATCSIDEYDTDLIKKHEKTRPDKENDRTRHIVTTKAQTGLIFLCYRETESINDIVSTICTTSPIYNFKSNDGIIHTIWKVTNTNDLVHEFEKIPAIYIADGHHRAASASRARAEFRDANPTHDGTEDYNYVIAALFPAEELRILPYNRIVKDLNGHTSEQFLEKLNDYFIVQESKIKSPENRGEISMYFNGLWYSLRFNVDFFSSPSVIESLDVSILEKYVLDPILGIKDVRTDKRIDFVGGIRGTEELEKLVNEGKAKVAFSMYPTTIDDLLSVSDENEVMPPKSTWFEPKLRDGLLTHKIQ